MSDQARDLSRGLYGGETPVRPAARPGARRRCLRGHDLAVAGLSTGYSHRYHLATLTCTVCWDLRDPYATWAEVDLARQHPADQAPTTGLALVRLPPPIRAGVGQLQLRIEDQPLADLDLTLCRPCRRAVLEHIRTDQPRRGFGRVLVAAALALAPPHTYRWSTTTVGADSVARAFWAALDWPGQLGEPDWCTDMNRAAGRLPDW